MTPINTIYSEMGIRETVLFVSENTNRKKDLKKTLVKKI